MRLLKRGRKENSEKKKKIRKENVNRLRQEGREEGGKNERREDGGKNREKRRLRKNREEEEGGTEGI